MGAPPSVTTCTAATGYVKSKEDGMAPHKESDRRPTDWEPSDPSRAALPSAADLDARTAAFVQM
jgi:hypothetical protein